MVVDYYYCTPTYSFLKNNSIANLKRDDIVYFYDFNEH